MKPIAIDLLQNLSRILRVLDLELSVRCEAGAFRAELRDQHGLSWRHGDEETLESALCAAVRAVQSKERKRGDSP